MEFQHSNWPCYRSSETRFGLVDKKERSCKIIDFAVPGGSRIEEKEKDKMKNIKTWEGSYRRYGMLQ